jgi:hypothetical protein
LSSPAIEPVPITSFAIQGNPPADSLVHHVYTLRGHLAERMEIHVDIDLIERIGIKFLRSEASPYENQS